MSEPRTPRITVVVPTFNRAPVLAGCLDALATQDYPGDHFDVVVVDDGSIDETQQVCKNIMPRMPMLQVHRQQNRGPAAARNAGIRLARGEIVAFTDDDCVPPPDWLQRIDRTFRDDPTLVGVGGVMITPSHEWIPLTHHSDLTEPGSADYSKFIGTNNAAYRREVLLKVNGFDETFRHVSVEDAELYIRMRREGRALVDPYLYVVHPPRSMGFGEAVRGYMRFYEGYVALQRRYPHEFAEIYGESPERNVLKGRAWGPRIRRYIPGMIRHPWRGAMFVAYMLVTRASVVTAAMKNRTRERR